MDLIGLEVSEFSALELEKFALFYFVCLHSSICKYWPISTDLATIYLPISFSDEFDYRTNQTRKSGVIYP